ncbi:hypothetical protein Ae168Ps1_2491 [Pseudonocardia sp. Ae168_Ps1]|nr:hypothetical protein Ae150APs1_2484 [Pseudonocardia sp. Ae150A_Ps1]OLL80085.1 hypothetical protein Ae168Ps1_2491 [Pseudonocardia sp. Ae168_Ps1]OLL85784.1 hypothetical protein Ae263Ps1_2839c [Pseudonocardia sp. Ae263_Ps1]OLL94185.1 hypothetical protein Ae356Ps1_4082 [Pseudonocardia sp. Ae356_Ps1]
MQGDRIGPDERRLAPAHTEPVGVDLVAGGRRALDTDRAGLGWHHPDGRQRPTRPRRIGTRCVEVPHLSDRPVSLPALGCCP